VTTTQPAAARESICELTLFVSGASELSAQAITEARRLCESGVTGPCRLSVVDIHADPGVALSRRVIATPTLIKSQPSPERRFVGDLSRTPAVLLALELPVSESTRGSAEA
jgi:circadian clock protein KaiB